MKLLLWDIDGTLVNVRRLGARALNEALHELYGKDSSIRARSMAGKTDLQILDEFLSQNAIPCRDLKAECRKVVPLYLRRLKTSLKGNTDPFLYPNTRELLARYSRSSGIVHGLLTGNFKPTARAKLEHFSLWRFFRIGAFGETSTVRADLAPAALADFTKKTGKKPAREDVFVIGDTPNDVLTARTHNLRSIAVATGNFSVDELRTAGAEFVLKDLTEFPLEIFE